MSFERYHAVTDYQWLYLDLNSYFASVEQQVQPALRGRPVAVVPLMSDTTCAIAASYEAKRLGIKTGTPVYEAKRICPDIALVVARHYVYVDYHHRIMHELDKHLPIEDILSIDEAACRLMAEQCEHKAAVAIAERIKDGIHHHVGEFIHCSIGIAPNRYLAKVATDLQKPNGLTVITATTMQQQLMPLSLRDLPGIGVGMQARLLAAGIHSVAQLWALDARQLRQLWGGVAGERFWYALHGIQLDDITTHRRTVGHSHVLAPELRPQAEAFIVAQRLLLKAVSRLRRMGYDAGALYVSVRLEQGERYKLDRHIAPACDSITLKAALSESWQQLMKASRGGRIKKVVVTLHDLRPHERAQGELFAPNPQQRKYESLSLAMDQLNEKFGRDTISMGVLPRSARQFSGTKIAFSRIPDKAEFHE